MYRFAGLSICYRLALNYLSLLSIGLKKKVILYVIVIKSFISVK